MPALEGGKEAPLTRQALGMQMELTKGSKSTVWLGSICLVLFVLALVFRATIYNHMYIAPDEPYGISDIIEFILGIILMVFMSLSIITSVFLLVRGDSQSKKSAVYLIVFCILLYFLQSPLHDLAAKWAA